MQKKLAVLIAGPNRYVNSVTRQIEVLLGDKIEFDIFYFLWKEDLGTKKRLDEENNYDALINSKHTKSLIFHKPYSEDEISTIIGYSKQNTHSPINAIMGMFYSMNLLCHHLKLLPDFNTYTHILRLRTDSLFLNEDFFNLLDFDSNAVQVSKNHLLENDIISDHIMFAKKELFFHFWKFEDIYEISELYKKAGRNPEYLLTYIAKKKKLDVKATIIRYVDYYIIYNPVKENELKSLQYYFDHNSSMELLFKDPLSIINKEELSSVFNEIVRLNKKTKLGKLGVRVVNKLKKVLK